MDANDKKSQKPVRRSCKCGARVPGIRYIFTTLGFLGFCVIYALRVNLNVAIVAMVNNSVSENASSSECPVDEDLQNNSTETIVKSSGEFDWSPNVQAIILGSFYIGYCIFQVPGGRVAETYGAKIVFGYGVLLASILSLFTPLAARCHIYLLIAIRFAEGCAQGVTMPAMHSLLGKWIPEPEKGLLSTLVYMGINIGTVVAMPLSGILCNSDLLGGWPSVFYSFGFCGCLWFILWMTLVSETPIQHPWITKAELKYIVENQKIEHLDKLPPIPWKSILKSIPFWALIVTQFGQDYCFYTLLNELPTFMSTILHFRIEANGFLSALPYVFQTIVGCAAGCITDYLLRKKWCSTAVSRKFCNTFACVGSAVGLVGVCLAGCDAKLTVAMFITCIGLQGFCYCGYMLTHLDLSPEYAGTLMGISNTLSNLTGYIAPAIVGSLTEKHQTLQQWRIIFYIVIVILITTSLVYLFFSTADKQRWVPSRKYTLLPDDESLSENYGSLQINVHYNDTEATPEPSPVKSQAF